MIRVHFSLRLCLLLGCIAIPRQIEAQIEFARRATLADSLRVEETAYRRLFAGIDMSPTAQAAARMEIRRNFILRMAMPPATTQPEWERLLALRDRRDSVLMVLPMSPEHRKVLGARLEKDRPPRQLHARS